MRMRMRRRKSFASTMPSYLVASWLSISWSTTRMKAKKGSDLPAASKVEVSLSSNDDDFDISLPLEQRKPVHSLHEDEESVDQSLSNQSTTDDVSELVEEPVLEREDKTEGSEAPGSASAPQETHVDESQLTEEQDHSMEEIVATNESIEVTYEAEETVNTSQKVDLITDLDEEQEEQVQEVVRPTSTLETLKLPPLQEPQIMERKAARALSTLRLQPEALEPLELTILEMDEDDDEDEDDDDEESSLQLMKLRLMAMNQQMNFDNAPKLSPTEAEQTQVTSSTNSMELKQMERVPLTEFSKDVLEDITEESERMLSMSTTTIEEEQGPPSLSLDESKTLLQAGTNKAEGSSSSLVSLNMLKQLEAKVQELHTQLETKDNCLASLNMQLEAGRRESSAGPASARDSSSLMTNSTEYRTLQDELEPTIDIYVEMTRRDETIAKLADSLEQSLKVRDKLQTDAERLGGEVQNLRRQLQEAIEAVKRSSVGWADQECNPGQRLSEISMDLISESDDDLDRHFLTDNEERGSRSSKERQLPQFQTNDDLGQQAINPEWTPAFSKQIEQFHTYLLPAEQRIFLMVQRKFDDYLSQQIAQCRELGAQELKIARDQWESEKQSSEQGQQAEHAKQMEELRKYFEHKCADLEKQFSDDVFSHKSQHLAGDSSSECSEMDQLPEELATAASSKEPSPRKRKRAVLLLSPSHRQMTPCGLDSLGETTGQAGKDISIDVADLKIFYQTHIKELKRAHEDQVRKLSDRIKFYERRQGDDDYKPATESPARTCAEKDSGDGPANTSLIIIDEDELNFNNESQVIQRIIEEYERRLQEQLALARQDIATELEQQIQNLLSENTVDDQHWPKELILLREKFTAKSQLEITQLNIKHADEMSRIKLEYEKQLNRKNKRHLTFDAARDLEQVICERDGLRELSKSFRSVLCRLAKCVANCEEDLNATLSDGSATPSIPQSQSGCGR
ncbi:hypothetical protein M5D96_009203 [Drosophila gunungcola]|uniref:Uncharacterized protein n=1 Tax=Drosophila gunungcola TaxID=103775 RepID=A0A9P9YJF6_9MUSC|nr:hypothetical protein M5D96_009203 [Drosophila gunungcola]